VIGIVVPVKRLQQAKSRLSGFLEPAARQQLVITLVRHVINTVYRSIVSQSIPARIWLVSPDPTLRDVTDNKQKNKKESQIKKKKEEGKLKREK